MEREDWLDSSDPRRAAAAWHALMQSDTLDELQQRRFSDWLCKSPTNVAEYLRLIGVREHLRDPAVFEGISLTALQAKIGGNVEDLPLPYALRPSGQRGWVRWVLSATAAATLLILGAFLLNAFVFSNDRPQRYATAIGEQRSIVLPDGSIAELNTRSTLEVRFTGSQRDILLDDGAEALFRVSKDPRRPFRVHSGATVVQAVGTEFTVRRESDRTTVTVLEGRVRVAEPSQAASASVELVTGQRLALQTNKPVAAAAVESIDTEVVLAWKTRRLVFDDLPLEKVIAEFNRYNERQIDPASVPAHLRRITGVFNANDPDSFLQFLKQSRGQRVDSSDHGSQNH